ncbi:MAG: NAD(P)H-dependent oxidoreductase [Lachnospiraceae bacterium]|nr:NAD(P)H-dependent oxidoreductase [Lachnospiraceae bacterium]
MLFINACVRKESRTKKIADALIAKLGGEVDELVLHEQTFPQVNEHFINKRDELKEKGSFSDSMFDFARQFASAERIVIAAPFYDMSFPASLKQYFELINVGGVTFTYTEEGALKGLCGAKDLYYVTTSGGPMFDEVFGFGYVKALAQNFYGIPEVKLIKAIGLDIYGADADAIVNKAIEEL